VRSTRASGSANSCCFNTCAYLLRPRDSMKCSSPCVRERNIHFPDVSALTKRHLVHIDVAYIRSQGLCRLLQETPSIHLHAHTHARTNERTRIPPPQTCQVMASAPSCALACLPDSCWGCSSTLAARVDVHAFCGLVVSTVVSRAST